MKSLIISILILVSFSSNAFSQVVVLSPFGDQITIDTPKIIINVYPLETVVENDSTLRYVLRYNTNHFKATPGIGLELSSIVAPKTPVPSADLRQPQVAIRNQVNFTFRNLPNINRFLLTKGRLVLIPIRDYNVSGNVITTVLPSQSGTVYEVIFLDAER